MPTVCGLCPVGCNVAATTREGKVKRILSRNHPEVDEGWLCDKGRFAFTHLLRRATGSPTRCRACGGAGFEAVSWDDALDEAERLLARGGRQHRHRALRLRDGRAGLRARRSSCARASARTPRVLPEETSDALDAFRLPLSAIARRRARSSSLGDEPVVERAPVVDLWLKAARRNGAEVVTIGPTATIRRARSGRASAGARGDELGKRLARSRARDPDLVGPRRAGRRARSPRSPRELGLGGKAGSRRVPPPAPRRTAAASPTPGRPRRRARPSRPGADRAPDRLRRRGRRRPGRPRARRAGRARDRDRDVPAASPSAGPTSSCPATSYLERDGTSSTSRAASSACAARSSRPCPDELAWIAKLAERFDVDALAARRRASSPSSRR